MSASKSDARREFLANRQAQSRVNADEKHDSPRGVYLLLRGLIRHRVYGEGHVFIESEVMELSHSTRAAARTALQMLAQDGLVDRRAGGGTVLRNRIVNVPIGVGHHAAGADWDWARISVDTLRRVETGAGSLASLCLDIDYRSPVIVLDRLVHLAGLPLWAETNIFRPDDERRPAAETQSTPRTSRRRDLTAHLADMEFGRSREFIEAIACDLSTSKLLRVEHGAPILQRETVLHDAGGRPIQLTFAFYRGNGTSLFSDSSGGADSGAATY